MQLSHAPACACSEDAALLADLRGHLERLAASLPGAAAEELRVLAARFPGLPIASVDDLQARIAQEWPLLHAQLQRRQLSERVALFAALRFPRDRHRRAACVSSVRRYMCSHGRLQLVVRAMDANGSADAAAIARFFALLMQLHTRVGSVRGAKTVLRAIALLPGTSCGSLETGSGMTLATAARLLLVHHVLGTAPCRKPNRRSVGTKRPRRVYEEFAQSARDLPTVEEMLILTRHGGAAPAPALSSDGWSSDSDLIDGGSFGGSSSSSSYDEMPRSKSPRISSEGDEYGFAESKLDEDLVRLHIQQESITQEILSQGLFPQQQLLPQPASFCFPPAAPAPFFPAPAVHQLPPPPPSTTMQTQFLPVPAEPTVQQIGDFTRAMDACITQEEFPFPQEQPPSPPVITPEQPLSLPLDDDELIRLLMEGLFDDEQEQEDSDFIIPRLEDVDQAARGAGSYF